MITLNNLNKSFDNTIALKNINETIEDHVILGLIGANGAGKSTLMKLISSQLIPTSGQVSHESYLHNYSNVCMMSDNEKALSNYSLKELYKTLPEFYKDFDLEMAKELSKTLDVNEKKKYTKLSKGQKGKVNLVIAISSHANITLLDETYISLDAPSRYKLYDFILDSYQKNPRTFIISTHYVDEVSRLFENIMLLDKGEVIVHESKDEIESKSYTLFGPTELGNQLLSNMNIIATEEIGKRSLFSVYDDISIIEKELLEHNFEISLTPLEKWYVQLIGRGSHE